MRINIFYLLLLIILITSKPTAADHEDFYVETIESYSRLSDQTLRWDMKREFLLKNYEFVATSNSPDYERNVTFDTLHDTQAGQYESIMQPAKKANFQLVHTYWDESKTVPKNFEWSIYMFRDVNNPEINNLPLDEDLRFAYSKPEHRRFDLKSTTLFFSVNLQHYEIHWIGGEEVELKVNTELSTKNHDDGRIIRSAVHLIKRTTSGEVVFDYNHVIQEESSLYKTLNLLDQPYLLVPYQFAVVIILVTSYIFLHKYIKKHGLKIVKTRKTNDILETSDEDSDFDTEAAK